LKSEHNTRFKPDIHPDLSDEMRNYALELQRSTTAMEHTNLAK